MNEVMQAQVTVGAERLADDGALVTARGELDVATCGPLREALTRVLDDGARRLVVDLRGVSFLDSITVAILVNASRRVDGRFAVAVEPGTYAGLIFEVAGLLEPLGVRDSLDAALARAAVAQ